MSKTPGREERDTLQSLINAQHLMLQNAFQQVKMATADRDSWHHMWMERVKLCEQIEGILNDVAGDHASFDKMRPRTQESVKRMLVYLGDA